MKIIFLTIILMALQTHADQCLNWFNQSKLKRDSACVIKCSTLAVDISNFECPNKCPKLCGESPDTNIYGLTDKELSLAQKNPIKMANAYMQSWSAEKACSKIYKYSDTNDESDACRHYIWAAYLTKKYDREVAEEILNAHEDNSLQPVNEKAMDLANNRRGVSIAESLIKKNMFTDENLINSFRQDLQKNNLIILKRGQP